MWPEKHRPCQLSGWSPKRGWSSPPWWHVWMVMDPAIKVVPHASGWPVSLGWSPSLAPLFPLGANMGSIVFVEQAPSPGLHRLFCLCGGHAGEEMDGFRPRDLAVPSPAFTTSTLDSLGPATSPSASFSLPGLLQLARILWLAHVCDETHRSGLSIPLPQGWLVPLRWFASLTRPVAGWLFVLVCVCADSLAGGRKSWFSRQASISPLPSWCTPIVVSSVAVVALWAWSS